MQAEALLREAPFAYVAMVDDTGPYVVPMNFAYEPKSGATPSEDRATGLLYIHTSAGRKTAALAQDPRVCIAITAEPAFSRGAGPCNDGFTYRSALVRGRAARLESRDERDKALRTIVEKYDPEAAAVPFDEDDFAQALVYAISIETITYKERPRHRPE